MILHLLRMRKNVNRNVFNDQKNVSVTTLRRRDNVGFTRDRCKSWFRCRIRHILSLGCCGFRQHVVTVTLHDVIDAFDEHKPISAVFGYYLVRQRHPL